MTLRHQQLCSENISLFFFRRSSEALKVDTLHRPFSEVTLPCVEHPMTYFVRKSESLPFLWNEWSNNYATFRTIHETRNSHPGLIASNLFVLKLHI